MFRVPGCWLLCAAACSSSNEAGEIAPDDAAAAGDTVPADGGWGWIPPADAATYAPSYYAVYYEVFRKSCALLFCHAADGYFTLATPELGYETLVDVPASSQECAATGLVRVKPGSPEQSLLYLKITDPPCGELMPLQIGGSIRLEDRRVEQIRQWIEAGAKAFESQADAAVDSNDDGG
jgi:hypothetical protein